MTIVRVTPEEAVTLLEEGYTYVDVRTEAEFERGHVPGAFNVPSMLRGAAGLVPNPDFANVMNQSFGKGDRLLIGCQSGGRSAKAAAELERLGFMELRELKTGWDGSRDAFGRVEPGWGKKGLPVETLAQPGRSYEELKRP
jgi:rhodanese-related sulfurtransferase